MYTLLVVDDEPNIVEGLASQFGQRYGDSVIVLKSYSGEHAISLIRNNKVCLLYTSCGHASRTARSVAARSNLRTGRGAAEPVTPAIWSLSPVMRNISSIDGSV